MNLSRRLAAEALSTTFLLAVVVGSGIMGERRAAGNIGIALLANSIATGADCGYSSRFSAPSPVLTLIRRLLWRLRPPESSTGATWCLMH